MPRKAKASHVTVGKLACPENELDGHRHKTCKICTTTRKLSVGVLDAMGFWS